VAGVQAVLIDIYNTALTCNFSGHDRDLAALAGVPVDVWRRESEPLCRPVMNGRLTLAGAFGEVLTAAGLHAEPGLLATLVEHDQRFLINNTSVYPDTVEFLEFTRARGVKTAFVSNCAENTRPLLDQLGLARLVDSVVLSCEVGASKPAPAIYRRAVAELGVTSESMLFVDDQEPYCEGAASLGMSAIRIFRRGDAGPNGLRRLLDLCDLL